MTHPHALVMSGYGINCEAETARAFERAGARAEIGHINDVIEARGMLDRCQILVFPGGFSYGDDLGAGRAFALKARSGLGEKLVAFVEREDTLTLGVCNGFQILVNLGLLPALGGYGTIEVALVHNDSATYVDRWVDVAFAGEGPWTRGLGTLPLPIAHGEGKFYAEKGVLAALHARGLVAGRYVDGNACRYQNYVANPNGSLDNIAGITDTSGRILGMMPHPERAVDFTQLPCWPWLKEQYVRSGMELPQEGPGIKLFRNAVEYFR